MTKNVRPRCPQEVKEQHSKVIGECHSHFRDWDAAWKDDKADIIVVTAPKS